MISEYFFIPERLLIILISIVLYLLNLSHHFNESKEYYRPERIIKNKLPVRLKLTFPSASENLVLSISCFT